VLKGSTQNDRLEGRNGADTLRGLRGTDTLVGGLGGDTFVYANSDGQDTITDFNVAEDKVEVLDYLNCSLVQEGSNLRIVLDGFNSILLLNVQREAFTQSNINISTAPTLIVGTASSETLVGTAFADVINGVAGNDILRGDAGDDVLDGGGDNDVLEGGLGNDNLIGGLGIDRPTTAMHRPR
jgi:Ca2+-binding RTX toxin-like protein